MNPLEMPFFSITEARKTLYQQGILKTYKMPVKIASVGNLTFGGTGKSPFVDFLVKRYSRNQKIAVLSRGYKRKTKGFFKVNINENHAATLYGDEPCMLKLLNPQTSIYVCEDRKSGVEEILKEQHFDWILLDDAHQHYRIQKDLDILLIDATESLENYRFPPLGRLRSSINEIRNCHIRCLTKVNLVTKAKLSEVKNLFGTDDFLMFESHLINVEDPVTNKKIEPQPINLISSIAKPKNLELQLKLKGFDIHKHWIYSDHYNFSENDIRNIKKDNSTFPMVCTQKDYLKIKNYFDSLFVTMLNFNPLHSIGKIDAYFS